MNLLRFLLCSLTALSPLASLAQSATPKPFLWRIDGAKPSYLFGTIHLANPEVTRLSEATTRAADSVDALYCELPLDLASQMKMAGELMSEGQPLNEVLPRDLYDRAEAELKRINPALNLAPFAKMKIWALSVTLAMIEEQLKYMGAQPLDAILYNRAAGLGKEVGGLETIKEQLSLFDQFTTAEQIDMLRASLDDMDRARRDGRSPLAELRESYLSGDLAKVEKTTNDWMENIDPAMRTRFTDALLLKRNHLMAERIAAKLKQSPARSYFFAVGAAHLYGPEGLLAVLEKAGYKLTRVSE